MTDVPFSPRVPPCDLAAEGVVLGAIITQPNVIDSIPGLEARHFYSGPNRLVIEAALDLYRSGRGVDLVSIAGWLRDRGKYNQVGAPYLGQIEVTPAAVNIEQHAARIMAKWRLRQTIQLASMVVGLAHTDEAEELERYVGELGQVVQADPGSSPWGPAGTWEQVLGHREPIRWLCKPLGIAPGLPTLVAGLGYSGKTVAVQALAVSVMSGRPVWGVFGVERAGGVLHLDYEQGPNPTFERYERLVRAMNLDPSELKHLDVRSMPCRYLDQPGVSEELKRMARGFELMIVDSYRAACPTIDENSSEARNPIDMLRRVSIATGCSVVIIHHGRKTGEHDTKPKGGQGVRGTTALFDAPSSVVQLEGIASKKPGVNRSAVEHTKLRETGLTLDSFTLEIEDVGTVDDPRDGLLVTAIQEAAKTPEAEARKELAITQAKILELLERQGGQPSRQAMRAKLRIKQNILVAALDQLVSEGKVEEQGKRSGNRIRLATLETDDEPEAAD